MKLRGTISLTSMPISPRTVRISAALLISVLFIAAGWFLAPSLQARLANADSTQAALEAYAKKDTDKDGLPDWKESLYGTDPTNPHSVTASLTDGEAVAQGKVAPKFSSSASSTAAEIANTSEDDLFTVDQATPGSVTDEFAKSFLETYVNEDGGQGNMSQDQIVSGLTSDFGSRISAKIHSSYSASSVTISSSATVSSYVSAVETAFTTHSAHQDPDALITTFVTNDDPSAKPGLLALAASYKATAADIAKVPVPASLSATDLALLQSLDLLSQSMTVIAGYKQDPLATLGALGVYQGSATSLATAVSALATAVRAEGEPAPGTPGYAIVNTADSLSAMP
jgi:hypothetical protein